MPNLKCFDYYSRLVDTLLAAGIRRVVSDSGHERHFGGGSFSGPEIESGGPGGRDSSSRFKAEMPAEGPLIEAGLELWSRGIYNLVTRISRDYSISDEIRFTGMLDLFVQAQFRTQNRFPLLLELLYGLPIEIPESGGSHLDAPSPEEGGRVPDGRRIEWYRQVLAELTRAIADGAGVRAFHAWTLLDNFQWAKGHAERYGLIHTDFRTPKRTIKNSVLRYGRVAATNRLDW